MTVKKGLEGKMKDDSEEEEFKITSDVKHAYAQAERFFSNLNSDDQMSDPEAKIYFPKQLDPEADPNKQI